MATCDEMRLLIGPFDDGELEPHEMEEVAFHVVACVGCKAALDDYRELGVALRRTVIEPALDGFAAQVTHRIDHSWIPLHVRFGRIRDRFSRVGAIFEIAIVAAATAMITIVIAAPYAHILTAHAPAASPPEAVARKAPEPGPVVPVMDSKNTKPSIDVPEDVAMAEAQDLVSELGGGESPSVAVWNEPRTGTTVVWVPDQR